MNIIKKIATEYFRATISSEESNEQPKDKGSLQARSYNKKEEEKTIFTEILPYSKSLDNVLEKYGQVLSEVGIKDLCLLAGGKENPHKNILSQLGTTETKMGNCVKATLLASPTNEIEVLRKRQATLKELQKTTVSTSLGKILALYKKVESSILSFYTDQDPLKHKEYKRNLNCFYFKKFGLQRFNLSSIALQLGKLWKDFWLHLGFGFFFSYGIIVTLIMRGYSPVGMEKLSMTIIWEKLSILQMLKNIFYSCFYNDMVVPGAGIYNNFPKLQERWKESLSLKFFLIENFSFLFLSTLFLLLGIFFVYNAIKKYKKNKRTLDYLAERLLSFKQLLQAVEALHSLEGREKELAIFDNEYLSHSRALLQTPRDSSLGNLIHALRNLPLEKWSYFFSPQGKLLAAYKLLEKHKKELADTLFEIGQLDALHSIALHMKKSALYSAENNFVFTELVEKESSPILQQEVMWHPLIDAKKAIANNLEMGGKEGEIRTIILTGPNAGGKSTYLHGISINLVLGQTFGIATAKKSRQTIFYKIVTYFDLIQDISSGLSTFQSKVKGLTDLSGYLKNGIEGQFLFAMLDEPLSGTEEKIASIAGYKIIDRFHKEFPKALFIVVTHMYKLTELDKNKGCVNKQVYIEGDDKKYRYTYLIKPGKSNKNIALEILKKENLLDY